MSADIGCIVGPASANDVETFVNNCKPSARLPLTATRGGWFWAFKEQVQPDTETSDAASSQRDYMTFEQEGPALVDELNEECKRIKKDEPERANKKQGTKSQKQHREIAYEKFNNQVSKLAKRTGVITGKWLFMPGPEHVDKHWQKLVESLIVPDGALRATNIVETMKVSNEPRDPSSEYPAWVICVYCKDSWDEASVGKVFNVLVKELHLKPVSYKTDANTILGITSKHESGLPVSLWKTTHFMPKPEMDAFFSELNEKTTKAKEVKKKTAREEEEEGGTDGFDPVSDDEVSPPKKKIKS